jgi:ribosomal-protein-serine acetyltransferase
LALHLEFDQGVLRSLRSDDAEAVYALVDRNRRYLARWMPWAAEQTFAGAQGFIENSIRQEEAGEGLQLALTVDTRIAGVLGLVRLDPVNRSANAGYWLDEAEQGKGLATAGVSRLLDHAFNELELHRVEIRVAVGNERSRALPARLGFVEEGTLRESERLGDPYRDQILCSMLSSDWRA